MKSDMLRPGTTVECALAGDDLDKNVDVRKALIFDATDDEIIVSQTSPPLVHSSTGKKISLTYINKKEARRLGLSGEVGEIINDYRTSSKQVVSAILLKNISGIKSLNLRYSYRVRPPADYDIQLFIDRDKQLEMVDLSASGIKFSHRQEQKLEVDQKIILSLVIRGKEYVPDARVIRKEKGNKIGSKQFEFVVAQFVGFDKKLEDDLAREVREIDRYLRFHGVT